MSKSIINSDKDELFEFKINKSKNGKKQGSLSSSGSSFAEKGSSFGEKDSSFASLIHLPKNDKYKHLIYLGNLRNAEDLDSCKKHGIKYIATIMDNYLDLRDPESIEYKFFRAEDIETQELPLAESHEWISEKLKLGNVLVHCHAGISRSASLVIYFLMAEFGLHFRDALRHVYQYRPIICPNAGFQYQLSKASANLVLNKIVKNLEAIKEAVDSLSNI